MKRNAVAVAIRLPVFAAGSALARGIALGTAFRTISTANDAMCVLVQIETREAMSNLASILDATALMRVYRPGDLSADMGFAGNPQQSEAQAAIENAIVQIRAAGKSAGDSGWPRSTGETLFELGALFVAVGVDTLLARERSKCRAALGAEKPVRCVRRLLSPPGKSAALPGKP